MCIRDRYKGILAVALALEGSGHFHSVVVQLVFVLVHFCDVVVHRQFGQDVHAQHLQRMCGEVEPQCAQPNEVKHYEYRIAEGVLNVIDTVGCICQREGVDVYKRQNL